jgi:hypothetical protein
MKHQHVSGAALVPAGGSSRFYVVHHMSMLSYAERGNKPPAIIEKGNVGENMGRKVHPIGFRLGIIQPWEARWFAENNEYGEQLTSWIFNSQFDVEGCGESWRLSN